MRPGLTHGLKWHRGMTGYMLRPTPNPDRSGRDGTAEHALQRYKGLKPNGRDGEVGTGRSPQSPAALCADTLCLRIFVQLDAGDRKLDETLR